MFMKEEIDVFQNMFVPKHEILEEDEKLILLKKLNATEKQLPKIKTSDPAIKAIAAKKGDVVRITRNSRIAGKALYYRVVV
ncbi:MAG: DNA-directed RNA polymerase subunit H [Candidatus Aenigmarchaeota archaeon]|nr:DNA-directed RNA polymerase subunit H [Candidatus Aenigmarchaeota archaeon]